MCSLSLILIAFRCDFVAPHRIIEPPSGNVNSSEAKEPSFAMSLKVLEPPSSLQRLADYRKKMMIDVEGPVAPASVSRSDSTLSTDMCDQQVSSGASSGVLHTQTETESKEHPNSPVACTHVSNLYEPTPLLSNGGKLDLETAAVCLPAAVAVPSKVTPEPVNTQLAHEQDVTPKPEVPITVPVSTPVPTSLADSVSDAPVVFPLQEPEVCSAVDIGMSEQKQLNSHNTIASVVKVQKIVKLPAKSQVFPTGEDLSPIVFSMNSIGPSSSTSLLIEATCKKTTTVPVQEVGSATKPPKRKPVVANTDNPLTNYFRPVSITLTADDDEVDTSRTGSAQTTQLNVENSDSGTGTMAGDEPKRRQHTLEAARIVPEQTKVLEECPPPPLPHVEVKITTQENDETCEVSDRKQVSSPLKGVVERVKDFTVNKTFSSLEIMPSLNTECKEVPSREVSSCSRRKIRNPVKRNVGDPKLPPFKSRSKRVQHTQTRKQRRKVLLQDKLSESNGKCSKKRASGKPRALKCPSPDKSGSKNGNNDQLDLTRQEAVTGPETTSRDNTSPSLLPAASGRTSSKTKQIKSASTISEMVEYYVTIPDVDKLSKFSATGCQPEQILDSSTISDDVNTNQHCSSKCHINNSAHGGQVENHNLSPLCDNEQICDTGSSKQNVASSHGLSNTTVREVSGDRHCNGSASPVSKKVADIEVAERSMPNSAQFLMPHLEVQEISMANSAELLMPHLEVQEISKKLIKPHSCHSTMSLRSAKKDIRDMKMGDQNTMCKATTLKTDSDAQRIDVICTKQNISNGNDGFSDSLREVLTERTCSLISKSEATLQCVQTHNNSTSPHEVHKGSGKAADSEDVIENSQDSHSSLLIASKLPLIQKCSVSVCKIDTTLGPGATIRVPDGGGKHIVLMPDASGSPFKVYKDKPASAQQRKSPDALIALGKARVMTRRSANRSLIGKFTDVTEMDSIQDKPSMTLSINPSRGEGTEYPASECCVSEEVNTSRSEEGFSTSGKEDTPKPVVSQCEVISLAEGLKAISKVDSTVQAVIPKSEPEEQNTMLQPENMKTTVMKEGPEKSELNSSNYVGITGMSTTELRLKHIGVGKRNKNSSRVKNYTCSRGTTLVLRSRSGRMLTEDMEDRPQELVTPKSVSTNQCQRNCDKQTKDDNVSSVGYNISSPLNKQKISHNSGVTDNKSGAKKTPLNESNILDGNFEVPLPVQSRKRRASCEVPHRQAATTLDNPADIGSSKIKKLSMQNSEGGKLYAKSVCYRSDSAPSEVELCDVASSDSYETPSPLSSKSLVSSPSSLLRSFCTVLGSPETSKCQKRSYKCLGGRARYLLDCVGAVKDTGNWSGVRPEEIRSVRSGRQASLPLQRTFHLYSLSDGGSSDLGM